MQMNEERLLKAYIGLWNNREMSRFDGSPSEALKELVRRELLDENAHPRARKSILEKFYLSVKRVMDSSLSDQEKAALIAVYIEIRETL